MIYEDLMGIPNKNGFRDILYHMDEVFVPCLPVKDNHSVHDHYVSNYGRVYNSRMNVFQSPSLCKKGYVDIKVNSFSYRLHRLVLYSFNPIPNKNEMQVNHINGIKHDNRLCNLEWTTPLENTHHAINTGLNTVYGEGHPMHKFTETDVRAICEILCKDSTLKGVQICNILNWEPNPSHLELITNIRQKRKWLNIVNEYDFDCSSSLNSIGVNHHQAKHTEYEVRAVCECIKNNADMTASLICNELGWEHDAGTLKFINRIRYKDAWTHISKEYGI